MGRRANSGPCTNPACRTWAYYRVKELCKACYMWARRHDGRCPTLDDMHPHERTVNGPLHGPPVPDAPAPAAPRGLPRAGRCRRCARVGAYALVGRAFCSPCTTWWHKRGKFDPLNRHRWRRLRGAPPAQDQLPPSARGTGPSPLWTPAEDAWLLEHAHLPLPELVERHAARFTRPPRTAEAIRWRLRKHGRLVVHVAPDALTLTQIQGIMGLDYHAISYWQRQGWLPWAGRRPAAITPAEFEAFLRDHRFVLDVTKMRPGRYRTYLEELWRRDPWYTLPQVGRLLGVGPHNLPRLVRALGIETYRAAPYQRAPLWIRREDVAEIRRALRRRAEERQRRAA